MVLSLMPPPVSSVIWSAQKLLLTSAVPSSWGQNLQGHQTVTALSTACSADHPRSTSKGSLAFSHHTPDVQPLKSGCYLSSGLVTAVFLLSSPAPCILLLVLWSHTSHQELVFTHYLRGHPNPLYNPSSPHQSPSEATCSYLDISILF